jgi:hypothetical protein
MGVHLCLFGFLHLEMLHAGMEHLFIHVDLVLVIGRIIVNHQSGKT